ncbi:MAG: AAA family ATPase [Thermodesulfobacteriota bacterium]
MWIKRIHIACFGGSQDLAIDGFGPGMNVVVGPNEAGKSTVAEFVRGMLFGFRRRNARNNVYESPDGLPRSGWLTVSATDGRRYRIQRKEAPKRREGILAVYDENGTLLDPALIPAIDLDASNTYGERLFAFDLDALRDLDRDALRGRIVGTSLGSPKVNPPEIVRRINLKMKALTTRAGRDFGSLPAVLARLHEVQRELKVRSERPQRHSALGNRLGELERSAEQLTAEAVDAEAKLRSLHDVLRYEEDCARLNALDHEIAALSDARSFPAQGLARLEQLIERLAEAGEALQRSESRATGLAEAFKGLDDELTELGTDWTRERLNAFDPSPALNQDIHRFSLEWAARRDALVQASQEMADAEEKCRQLAATIYSQTKAVRDLSDSCRDFLAPEQRALLSEWKDHQAAAKHQALRFSEAKAAILKLIDEAKRLTETREAFAHVRGAGWAWILVAILLFGTTAAGVSLIIGAGPWSDFNNWLFFAVGLFMAIAGPAGALAILGNRRAQQRRILREHQNVQHRIAAVSKEIAAIRRLQQQMVRGWKESRERMGAIAGTVLGNPSARAQDVADAIRKSIIAEDAVRKRDAIENSLRQANAQLQAQRARMAARQKTLDERLDERVQFEAQWRRFLRENGLEEDLEPEEAAELNRRLSGLKKDLRKIAELQTEHELLTRAEQQKVADLEARMVALLKESGAEDEESFRKQAVRYDRLRALEQEKTFLAEKLNRYQPADEDPLQWFAAINWAESRAEAEHLYQRLALLKDELERLVDQRGRVIGEIEALEAGDDTDKLLAEREQLRARLNAVAREWIVLRLAERLLSSTVSMYESERQPCILERASEIFRAITGDSFSRIRFPLEGSRVNAERPDGTIVPEEYLSRGTLEQLYLALRLAHIELDCVGDTPAPLVMDDVLVNFDPGRVRRSAGELEEFSRRTGTQILFFTCHPHVAACFSPETERIFLGQVNDGPRALPSEERPAWYAGS